MFVMRKVQNTRKHVEVCHPRWPHTADLWWPHSHMCYPLWPSATTVAQLPLAIRHMPPLAVNEISSLHLHSHKWLFCNILYYHIMYSFWYLWLVLHYIHSFLRHMYPTWRWPSQVAETCSWCGYLCYLIQLCYDWYILRMIVTLRVF